ncbi:hypothetical protein HPB49_006323 [Dermacentor silvarum]|uniref:Uncharacterized protein n=1 Tax=Dermacentor silvarum TaxID=543639 RepID=A0ACB8C7Q6_DERSI|nr:hypothetical protein HPB49_006323 [Dermacentor silvarum]
MAGGCDTATGSPRPTGAVVTAAVITRCRSREATCSRWMGDPSVWLTRYCTTSSGTFTLSISNPGRAPTCQGGSVHTASRTSTTLYSLSSASHDSFSILTMSLRPVAPSLGSVSVMMMSLCPVAPSLGLARASGLSTERKVLCALRFFGTGSFRRSVGREEQIGMAQPAASNTIQEVTEAIISVSARRKLVDFSLTPAAKDEAKAAFARRGAIPGVLACVDGTLIAVMKPEGLSPADTASFMSRKGYYALNVIVVCNSELCILVVDLRLPDSGHDSWMWQHNPLCTRLAAQLQPGESLLGKYS